MPWRGLPARARSSAVSIPWLTALRTRWVRGSVIASSRLLSRSVSCPLSTSSASLPQSLATSRTRRGKRRNSCSTGTIRTFITERCRSFKTRAWKAMASAKRPRETSLGECFVSSFNACCSIDLPMINSPTRLITLSMRSASTRSVFSGAVWRVATLSSSTALSGIGTEVCGSLGECVLVGVALSAPAINSTSTTAMTVGMRHFASTCSAVALPASRNSSLRALSGQPASGLAASTSPSGATAFSTSWRPASGMAQFGSMREVT